MIASLGGNLNTPYALALSPSSISVVIESKGRKKTQTILFAKSIGDNSPGDVAYLAHIIHLMIFFVVYSGLADRTDSGCK